MVTSSDIPIQSEQSVCITLMEWVALHPKLKNKVLHIPNERKCSPRQGHLLKLMGVRAGVCDYFIAVPTERYPGMWLEVKVGKNKPTENQVKFMQDMSDNGYYCTWQNGFEACKTAIENYLSGALDEEAPKLIG